MNDSVCRRSLLVAVTVGLLATSRAWCEETPWLPLPAGQESFEPNEGCRRQPSHPGLALLEHNAHYFAPPAPGEDWGEWLERMRAYRQWRRAPGTDPRRWHVELRFDGVRAWLRADPRWALAADLAPGERVLVTGQGRWLKGSSAICLAFDFCRRQEGTAARWAGWSTVLASTPIPTDGQWHDFRVQAEVPSFPHTDQWVRPILGMDGTFDAKRGTVLLRNLRLMVPRATQRAERFEALAEQVQPAPGFDDSIYRRNDLQWMTGNFVCGFLFVYDRSFWSPEEQRYRVAELCREAEREFGGYDSVVLWHAYPRIGADERNQFDFFRHMPGGLEGLREVSRQFHGQGVKVFLPYNPWDTGTRREEVPDEEALAQMIAAMEADGIFLDTMRESPDRLREVVDAARPGVAFEPEGHPAIDEIQRCSGSWAQWLRAFPGVGVLHLKWLQPRHMQHQIRRWDRSHQAELAAAWLNGSGILVWENIFGTWNPWNARDRATLRRMGPVLRHFASLLAGGEWLPCYPTLVPGVHASCWKGEDVWLWTILNETGQPVEAPILEVDELDGAGQRFFDLWRGAPLQAKHAEGKMRVAVPIERFGAVVAVRTERLSPALSELIETLRLEARRPIPEPGDDPHVVAKPVVEPKPPPDCPAPDAAATAGMLRVEGGTPTFVVRHMRRECGCYPDPDTPPESWGEFLKGNPHSETMEHGVTATLGPYWIDPQPVTNGQFQQFLEATGYAPECPDRFLDHWGGPTCAEALKSEPVVFVDLEDARAYAAWAGKRLPTEWEWHQAAELRGDAFGRSEVHEWTESERDDGHSRFVMLRGGCRYKAEGSIWYFPGGEQPVDAHAKFLRLYPGLDRCRTIGFRCVVPDSAQRTAAARR